MKRLGRVRAPGVGHRQHPAVPSPLAGAVLCRCEGRDGAGAGIGKGGAARSLPWGRGRWVVGVDSEASVYPRRLGILSPLGITNLLGILIHIPPTPFWYP